MITNSKQHAAVHRAIGLLIEVEQELEGVSRDYELKAAEVRFSLYSLLNLSCRDPRPAARDDRLDLDRDAVDEVLRKLGDGTVGDVLEPPADDGADAAFDFKAYLDSLG